jgi:hypothetical protein
LYDYFLIRKIFFEQERKKCNGIQKER